MTSKKNSSAKLTDEFKKKYIMSIKGKEHITYRGLLHLAHDCGIKSIKEEITQYPCQENNFTTFARGVIIDNDGNEFVGIGDANPQNCNNMIAVHAPRMAGTRAKGRALRDMLGLDMVMFEELSSPWEQKAVTESQKRYMTQLMNEISYTKEQMQTLMASICGTSDSKKLTEDGAYELISAMERIKETNKQPTEESTDEAAIQEAS